MPSHRNPDRGPLPEALWAVLAISGARLALWLVYLQARHFLVFLLPGYPTVDLVCRGAPCTLGAVQPLFLPLATSTAALTLLHLALTRWTHRDTARVATMLACAAPGSLNLLLAPGAAIIALALSVALFAASHRMWRAASLALGAACLLGPPALIPGVLALGLVVVAAPPFPPGVVGVGGGLPARLLLLVPLAAGALLRFVVPQAHLPLLPLTLPPGPAELAGVTMAQTLVTFPLLGLAAASVTSLKTRPFAVLCGGVLLGGVALDVPAGLQALALVPVVWLLPAMALRRWPALESGLFVALAMLQGVLAYHVAHQVPVL